MPSSPRLVPDCRRPARAARTLLACALLASCGGGDSSGDRGGPVAPTERKAAAGPSGPPPPQWSAPIALPIVPAAAANLPNGKLLLWSSQGRFSFDTSPGSTYTAIFDPVSGTAVERLVTETNHNMFCPGTATLPDGRILVSGGSSAGTTSLYDPVDGRWSNAAPLNITRAYHATTLLPDGSVFALGGSWYGGQGNKHAELWTAAGGWRRLSGVPVDPMLGADPAGVYRNDNHMWLLPTGNGRLLHAGPSAQMNWIDTRGEGASTPAGSRADDTYAVNGSVVMYEPGKILKTGGAPAYDNADASPGAYLIDTTQGDAQVRRLAPMSYARAFHNSVVLPNGQVLVIGGQTYAAPFSDNTSVLVPELWDPVKETFKLMPEMQVPRNYHSTALLLPDGRVASIGGGLCGSGCAANHADLQIFTPDYLLDKAGRPLPRPSILSAPAQAAYGTRVAVTTDAAVTAFSLVRLSATTHTVNNDQRRVPLEVVATGTNQYQLTLPTNPGIALPGYYMLFALDAAGVPSVARTVRLAAEATPQLTPPGDQVDIAGNAASLQIVASGPGTLSYAATGLPPGLQVDAARGAVTGTPTTPGTYLTTLRASNASGTVTTDLRWVVQPSGTVATRYVKFEALSEVAGRNWTSMAEFDLLDPSGAVIPRTGWTARADSQETLRASLPATNAIDGLATTFWHTAYSSANPPPPHWLIVDLGVGTPIGGMRVLPRQDSSNGRVAGWRLHVSGNGTSWRVVAQGTFANDALPKTVFPIDTGAADRWPVLQQPDNPTVSAGDVVSLALSAQDPDGDVLSYAASGLPPGLQVNAATGRITGSPTAIGVYDALATVSDGRGGIATAGFTWTVLARSVVIAPVAAPAITVGGTASYTADANAGSGATYVWDFGDATPPTAPSSLPGTSHSYAAPGLYAVTLTLTDASGAATVRSFTQAVYRPATSGRPVQSASLAMQSPPSGNARVWVVNGDAATVAAVDAVTLTKLAEVGVGTAPRSVAVAPDGRVWVVNKASANLSVIDPATFTVVRTIPMPRASMPYGIVFAPDGRSAYVSLEATGQLLRLDPVSGAVLATLGVGANPRQLAVTADGQRVLVSRFITPPQPGEATARVSSEVAGVPVGAEVVAVAAATFTVDRTIVLRHSDRPDGAAQGRGVPNYLGAPVIAPDGTSAWVPSKQDNIARGMQRDGLDLTFENTVRAVSSRIDMATLAEDYALRIDHDNAGRATAAAFHPTGAYLFVALQTSRQVTVIDPVRGVEMERLEVGRAPDALVVSADGRRLFVSNAMDRTLQAFDLSQLVDHGDWDLPSLGVRSTQAVEPLPAQVLLGKQLFHDAQDKRLAREGYLSCAVCHDDGGHDGRTWDMSGLGEGLRNTSSLRGRAVGQGRLHWSANFDEVQDFEGQIRVLAQGTGLLSDAQYNEGTRAQPLGLAKAGLSVELDALAAYVASIATFPSSPLRAADGSLTPAAAAGKAIFLTQCSSCHAGNAFTDSATAPPHDIGTLKPTSGQRLGGPLTGIDTPTLRDAWATAPYLHDGSAPTLVEAIAAHAAIVLADADRANVAAYVAQIGDEAVARTARFVRLEALSEVNGKPWTSMAEFNVTDAAGNPLPRTGWLASVDSQETYRGNYVAANAIDGVPSTYWHTDYSRTNAPPPHTYTVDLGAVRSVSGFRYLPRTDGIVNGRIAAWRLHLSQDGVTWTQVATGTFANTATEKSVVLPP
jgi:YVTN family beta-propeller protein